MIQRLYVHNFRCLENFDWSIANQHSVLLIGKNGTGKTTVGSALEVLQKVARGKNRVGELVKPKDFTLGRSDAPMRFEVEIELDAKKYKYQLALELPSDFKEMRVKEESLTVNGRAVYSRDLAQVTLSRSGGNYESKFAIDWHLVALPIIQSTKDDSIATLKAWLEKMLILRIIPSQMKGTSDYEALQPEKDASDFGAWFSGILATTPAAYAKIDSFLKTVMPDIQDIQNPLVGPETRNITLRFSDGRSANGRVPFDDLSDGEKCFMNCALVLACTLAWDGVFCFWDEPDNYLSLDEVGHVAMELRRAFSRSGQLIVCSHSPQLIERFSKENTYVLDRRNHLEPSVIRPLSEISISGDLATALVLGDVRVWE